MDYLRKIESYGIPIRGVRLSASLIVFLKLDACASVVLCACSSCWLLSPAYSTSFYSIIIFFFIYFLSLLVSSWTFFYIYSFRYFFSISVMLKIHWLCFLRRGKTPLPTPQKRCAQGNTLNFHWWWSSSSRYLLNMECRFIVITPRSTLNHCDRTCWGLIHLWVK